MSVDRVRLQLVKPPIGAGDCPRLEPGTSPGAGACPRLEPAGVVARGALVKVLARRLAADAALPLAANTALRGVVSRDRSIAVVLGASEDLPWIDGVTYVGVAAPGLYVPTTRALSVPAPLAAGALRMRLPAALLEEGLIPLAGALPITLDVLEELFA